MLNYNNFPQFDGSIFPNDVSNITPNNWWLLRFLLVSFDMQVLNWNCQEFPFEALQPSKTKALVSIWKRFHGNICSVEFVLHFYIFVNGWKIGESRSNSGFCWDLQYSNITFVGTCHTYSYMRHFLFGFGESCQEVEIILWGKCCFIFYCLLWYGYFFVTTFSFI